MGFVGKALKGIVKAVVGVVKGVVKVVGKVVGGLLGAIRPKGNAKNSASDGRLSKTLEPEDFRKIAFGETAFGTDIRFWEIHGTKNELFTEVLAACTHDVESFGNFYVEDELVLTGAQSLSTNDKYKGFTRTVNSGAVGAAALSVGSGTFWTSASKMTGCAHYALKWVATDKSLPGGVPSRITQVGKGARVYDPRKDSTKGGSGTHRVDDQSTWAYATLDSNGKPIGRNNALQMLWYLIGWRIANPADTTKKTLVAGRGIDPADINWPEMIAAANDAEARGYYTDMLLDTGDEHETNEAIISADGLMGELLDPGGLWTYRVTKDDTADIAVSLTEDHVLDNGPVEWTPIASMADQFNEVAGTYIDNSGTSLFQSKAYPTVTDAAYTTADGFRKRTSHNFQCVQDVSLAQKLARIKLNRQRFTGEFRATFSFTALKAQVWSVVRLSIERYGFVNKLFRVYSQTITEQGIEMLLREEDPSVYAGGTVTIPAAPAEVARLNTLATYPVEGFTGSAITSTAGGNNQVGVRLSWTQVPENVRRIELEFKRASDTTWQSTGTIAWDKTTVDILGLLGNVSYDFRIRTWSLYEKDSAWSVGNLLTAISATDWSNLSGTIPANIANASITVGANGAILNAGGGQVTLVGIGFVGDTGATAGDNFFRNGSFADGTAPWVVTNGARQAGGTGAPAPFVLKKTGGTYLEVSNGGQTLIPPSSTDNYLSFRGKGVAGNVMQIVLYWYDSSGALISQYDNSITFVNSNWNVIERRLTRPDNAAYFYFLSYVYENGFPTNEIYLTSLRFGGAQAGATLGADWPTNLVGRPTNLAALAGSEGLNNALITMGANGAILNAGGGQVLIDSIAPGLVATANSANQFVTDIADDNKFSRAEKKRYVVHVDGWVASVPAQVSQLNALGLTTEANNLTAAWSGASGFLPYLQGLSYTDLGTSATIVRATFNAKSKAFTDALIAAANSLDAKAATIANWTGLAGSVPANVANNSVTIGANGALLQAGGGQVSLSGIGYTGDPKATRNADGANMIPSPVALDRVELTGTAFLQNVASTGRQVSGGKRIGLTSDGDAVFWESASVTMPVFPGEVLYHSFAALMAGATITTDVIAPRMQCFDASFNFVSTVSPDVADLTGSAVTAAGGIATYRCKFAVPAGVAFVRVYGQRLGAVQGGTFYVSEVYLGRSEQGADQTSNITGVPELRIPADHLGVIDPAQFPKATTFRLFRNGVEITSGVAWSLVVISGSITHSITGSGSGAYSATALAADARVRVTAAYPGATRSHEFLVSKDKANPPVGGTGGSGNPGTSASTGSIASVSSTTHFVKAGPITCKAGTGGQVAASLSAEFSRSGTGTSNCFGKIQWRAIGGVWADITTETQSQFAATGGTEPSPGYIDFTATQTGLTSGTDYEFQLLLRGSTATALTFNGTFAISGT